MTYEVISPSIEFFDPSMNYLLFIEKAARTCYKSEEHIKMGSAEKLLDHIVNQLGHESVIEHSNAVMVFHATNPAELLCEIMGVYNTPSHESRSLFGTRASIPNPDTLILSGNIRMWLHLMLEWVPCQPGYGPQLVRLLREKWPFFFSRFQPVEVVEPAVVWSVDENPLSGAWSMTSEGRLRHMTMTYKLIGDRAMSHQLVRHRLAAFSQESQRYCDYSKKGFQFLIPPSFENEVFLRDDYKSLMVREHDFYKAARADKIPAEDARRPLGNATKTEVVVTFTLGMWRHFHKMRTLNHHAEWCIKGLGKQVLEHQMSILPDVFEDLYKTL